MWKKLWLRNTRNHEEYRSPASRPRTLFRYRSANCSAESRKYLDAITIVNKIYCPTWEQFNDPCETFYRIDTTFNEEAARRLLRFLRKQRASYDPDRAISDPIVKQGVISREAYRHINEWLLNMPEDEVISILKLGASNLEPDVKESMIKSQLEIDKTTIGICSFTELGTSPYMSWHYGDRHRGVCLEFSTAFPPFNQAVPVHYTSKVPTNKILGDPYETQRSRMQTKSLSWQQEKEWRFFAHPYSGGLELEFDPAALVSVSFCHLINHDQRTRILQTISDLRGPSKIEIYDLRLNREIYEFERKLIS